MAISGSAVARLYFRREYGEVAADGGAAPPHPDGHSQIALETRFASVADGQAGTVLAGSHKLARWRVHVEPRTGAALLVRAQVQGPFGLPLVQSLILEPLLGVAAARQALALVPGALLLDAERRGVLLVGGSGAGKTSLAARAIAAGRGVLADDRVFLDRHATASRFARRMRLYADIRETAPAAWEALSPGAQARLRAVSALRGASGGRFAPPVAVPRAELGAPPPPLSAPVGRILLLRRTERDDARLTDVSAAAAVEEIEARIRDDRAALHGCGLDDALRTLTHGDQAVLEAAVGTLEVQRLDIPLAWPAARSVQRLAAELGMT